ncbi:hypothetical protein BD414DRAFT_501592 [Trametes punicea]|nr:hypothetical protein BD414DRAFT_501592 [Trametes punicea]
MTGTRPSKSLFVLGLFALVRAQVLNLPSTIVSPKNGDVWTVGSTQTVEWSTQGVAMSQPNGDTTLGTLWLGYLTTRTNESSASDFTFWSNQPLSQGFSLAKKEVQVVVPNVPTQSTYVIIMGPNWDLSQSFTIENPDDPMGTGVYPSSLSVTTPSSSGVSSLTASPSTTSAGNGVAITSPTSPASTSGVTSSATSQSTIMASNGSNTGSAWAAGIGWTLGGSALVVSLLF